MEHKYTLNLIAKIFLFGLSMEFWSGDQQFATGSTDESTGDIPVFQITECEDVSLQEQAFAVIIYPFYLGRALDNDMIFQELSVSRAHAKITCRENEIFLQDRGSKYGTFVNEEKLRSQPVLLAYGDEIRLGAKTIFKLVTGKLDETIDVIKKQTTISSDLSNETTMLQPRDLE